MRQVEYNRRVYDVYEDIKEFTEYSGLSKECLIYESDLRNSIIDSKKEIYEIRAIGKYLVCKNAPIMPILGFEWGEKVIEILLPIGWCRLYKEGVKKVYRESRDNPDINFIAMFLMTGDLTDSYCSSYGKEKASLAMFKFLDIIEDFGLKERILNYMKEAGIKSSFEQHGLTDEYLFRTLKEKLDSGKGTVGDILKVMEAKKVMAPEEKKTLDTSFLPSLPTENNLQLNN